MCAEELYHIFRSHWSKLCLPAFRLSRQWIPFQYKAPFPSILKDILCGWKWFPTTLFLRTKEWAQLEASHTIHPSTPSLCLHRQKVTDGLPIYTAMSAQRPAVCGLSINFLYFCCFKYIKVISLTDTQYRVKENDMAEGQENAGLENSGPSGSFSTGYVARGWGPTHHTGTSTMVPAPHISRLHS